MNKQETSRRSTGSIFTSGPNDVVCCCDRGSQSSKGSANPESFSSFITIFACISMRTGELMKKYTAISEMTKHHVITNSIPVNRISALPKVTTVEQTISANILNTLRFNRNLYLAKNTDFDFMQIFCI